MINIVDSINSWAQGIVIAVIIGTIIEMLVPNGKNKKYIKTVIGMYILFLILYPIITKVTNRTINFNNIDISKYENTSKLSMDTKKYIYESYENNLKQEINMYLENKGYDLKDIDIKYENNYEDLNSIYLKISKKEIEVKNVEDIQIYTNSTGSYSNKTNEESNKENNENKEEIKSLTKELSKELNMDEDKITIDF